MVTSPLSTSTPGPEVLVDALATEPARSRNPTLATSLEQETSIANVMLSVVRTPVTEQEPDAPPITEKSPLSIPVIAAPKVIVNSGVLSERTEAVTDHSAVGTVASRITEEVEAAEIGPAFPT